jgi:hypothetical protein
MYVNLIAFGHVLRRVEKYFIVVGIGKDIGWVQQTTLKTTTYWKVNI